MKALGTAVEIVFTHQSMLGGATRIGGATGPATQSFCLVCSVLLCAFFNWSATWAGMPQL